MALNLDYLASLASLVLISLCYEVKCFFMRFRRYGIAIR